LRRILTRMLDTDEFLADHGIRSMSKFHKEHPYSMTVNGQEYKVQYLPGDSDSGLFGGNSNWRGPIWIAVNFLLIESLYRFYTFYGNNFQIECPTGSGNEMHLGHVAENIQHRITAMFSRDHTGRRAINAGNETLDFDENWENDVWFYEFFDGDTGRGLGATHQCGWTGLIAKIIHDTGINHQVPQTPRTPSTAYAHYFDDILTRTKPGVNVRRIRRSSTHRNIGGWANISGTTSTEPSIDGGDEDVTPEADEDRRKALRRKDSIGSWNMQEKQAMDDHVHKYVTNKLEALRTTDSALADDACNEVEARGDEPDYFQIKR